MISFMDGEIQMRGTQKQLQMYIADVHTLKYYLVSNCVVLHVELWFLWRTQVVCWWVSFYLLLLAFFLLVLLRVHLWQSLYSVEVGMVQHLCYCQSVLRIWLQDLCEQIDQLVVKIFRVFLRDSISNINSFVKVFIFLNLLNQCDFHC